MPCVLCALLEGNERQRRPRRRRRDSWETNALMF
jgi:hypothetical protein